VFLQKFAEGFSENSLSVEEAQIPPLTESNLAVV